MSLTAGVCVRVCLMCENDRNECGVRDMAATPEDVVFDLFGVLQRVCGDLEKSGSARTNAAVKTLLAHLQTCVARLYVKTKSPYDAGAEMYLEKRKNGRMTITI